MNTKRDLKNGSLHKKIADLCIPVMAIIQTSKDRYIVFSCTYKCVGRPELELFNGYNLALILSCFPVSRKPGVV